MAGTEPSDASHRDPDAVRALTAGALTSGALTTDALTTGALTTGALTTGALTTGAPIERRVIRVRGVVQGVGFRPFIFCTAETLGLGGAVWNDASGVVIDVEGAVSSLEELIRRLTDTPPPSARVETIEVASETARGIVGFQIHHSVDCEPTAARISADLATCGDCLAELLDAGDRRFRYPFINCTACGPRYSIVTDVPYDRPRTTMARFAMCDACAAEYSDPRSRRFHAQPNACGRCGPSLRFDGEAIDALGRAVAALHAGEIVAIKGLGGYQLACDARSGAAVQRLRDRKRRFEKPLAVMFGELANVEGAARLTELEREVLTSSCRPIVLVHVRSPGVLATQIAPGLAELGVMLPTTPLHHVLLHDVGGPLVMTSGNLSDEPIAIDDDEAATRLAAIADHFLTHDRPIHMRVDDSVVRVETDGVHVVRRARGYVPATFALEGSSHSPSILAVGADLKNAFCVTTGTTAILSQHIGDLESYEGQRFFHQTRGNLERQFRVTPAYVAHDLHPGYHSTAIARRTGLPAIAVQHHHAHVASVLAEHRRHDRVIGVVWDGTGFGPDGTVWGGEFLIADLAESARIGRLRPVALAGGDAAVRQPWRMALAHLHAAGLATSRIAQPSVAQVLQMIAHSAVTMTSSVGRLFDAVASLVGLGDRVSYEGQAAMQLEAVSADGEPYALPLVDVEGSNAPSSPRFELDAAAMIRAIVEDLDRGRSVAEIGGRFHAGLASGIGSACVRIRELAGLSTVVLSGGCFQNQRLVRLARVELAAAGFEVLTNMQVPCGDGGIALGQAAVAAWRLAHVPCDSR